MKNEEGLNKRLAKIEQYSVLLKKNLPTSSFIFVLESNDLVSIPFYTGSTFRGVFGVALKKVTCTLSRVRFSNRLKPIVGKEENIIKYDCKSCMFKSSCQYMKIFETYVGKEVTPAKKVHIAPHPYILEPPFNANLHVYSKGEEISVGVNLIGQHAYDLPYFIAAFSEFEKIGVGKSRGHLSLKGVFYKISEEIKPDLIYDGKKGLLYDPNVKNISYFDKGLVSKILEEQVLIIKFLTPARIVYDKELVRDLTFLIFLKNLLSRINQLSVFYSEDGKLLQERGFDIKILLEKSKNIEIKQNNLYWFDWERYSKKQRKKMILGGLMGNIVFEGDFSDFIPPLLLGEQIHVGKNTTFGLGKYVII